MLPQLLLVEKIVAMCGDPEAVSHGPACLADDRDTPVALRQGDRRPWCEGLFVGGALCTGTGPGLTPAIRAGEGWRGRRES